MATVSVVTWNLNSIRLRLFHLLDFLKEYSPDIVLLQEIKCETEKFPRLEIEELGYNIAVKGQPSFNGIAILSKSPIEDVFTDLIVEELYKNEARYIEGFTSIKGVGLRVASVYVPQGTELYSQRFDFKLRFYEYLKSRCQTLLGYDEALVVGGDYNVAPELLDVYNTEHLDGTLGFHIEERKRFRSILNTGMKDAFRLMNPEMQEYSWWDYRSNGWRYNKGMRLDHLLVAPSVADKLKEVVIYTKYRGLERPSDHAPVICTISV